MRHLLFHIKDLYGVVDHDHGVVVVHVPASRLEALAHALGDAAAVHAKGADDKEVVGVERRGRDEPVHHVGQVKLKERHDDADGVTLVVAIGLAQLLRDADQLIPAADLPRCIETVAGRGEVKDHDDSSHKCLATTRSLCRMSLLSEQGAAVANYKWRCLAMHRPNGWPSARVRVSNCIGTSCEGSQLHRHIMMLVTRGVRGVSALRRVPPCAHI